MFLAGLFAFCINEAWLLHPWLAFYLLLGFIYLTYRVVTHSLSGILGQTSNPMLLPSLSGHIPNSLTAISALVYTVKAHSVQESNEAVDNLKHAFEGNGSDKLYAIYLSATDKPSVLRQEISAIRVLQEQFGKNRFFLFHRNPRQKNFGHKWGAYQDLFYFLRTGQNRPHNYNQAADRKPVRRPNAVAFAFSEDLCREGVVSDKEAETGTIGDLNGFPFGSFQNAIISDFDTIWPKGSIEALIAKAAAPENSDISIFQPIIRFTPPETIYGWIKTRHLPFSIFADRFFWRRHGMFTFYGKGLIRIEPYCSAVADPEVLAPDCLSHDFLEAYFLRSALVEDVEILESTPPSYMEDLQREFRWVVGDVKGLAKILGLGPSLAVACGLGKQFTRVSIGRDVVLRTKAQTVLDAPFFTGWLVAFTILEAVGRKNIQLFNGGRLGFLLFAMAMLILLVPRETVNLIPIFLRKDYLRIPVQLIAALGDMAVSTVISLQTAFYKTYFVCKAICIEITQATFEWRSNHSPGRVGLWANIINLKYTVFLGLGWFLWLRDYKLPEPVLLSPSIVTILALNLGPIIMWFIGPRSRKETIAFGVLIVAVLLGIRASQVAGKRSVVSLLSAPVRSNLQVLLICDFNDGLPVNRLGGRMEPGRIKNGHCRGAIRPIGTSFAHNSALELELSTTEKGDVAYWWCKLGPERGRGPAVPQGRNLEEYDYISFLIESHDVGKLTLDLHSDTNGDGVFDPSVDETAYVYAGDYLAGQDRAWCKIVVPLSDFRRVDLSRVLEICLVDRNRSGRSEQRSIFIDDLLLGRYLPPSIGPPVEIASLASLELNNEIITDGFVLRPENSIKIIGGGVAQQVTEAYLIQLSTDSGSDWITAYTIYWGNAQFSKHIWEITSAEPEQDMALRIAVRTVDGSIFPISHVYAGGKIEPLSPEEFLNLVEKRAFQYFRDNQSKTTGLFADASGGGDASIAVTGFGLAAMCVGAERGWIERSEAEKRVGLCVRTFLPEVANGRPSADNKNGVFYHFLDMETAEKSGDCEASTVDTAILAAGMLTAGEYFGGEIKSKAKVVFENIQWDKFIEKRHDSPNFHLFSMGMDSRGELIKSYWDFYSDETLLINLLALGSPHWSIPSDAFYAWTRRIAGYGNERPFIYSWCGSLFTYQYAHAFFDFRGKKDRNGVDWWANSVNATLGSRRFCINNSPIYETYGPNSWGITGMFTPQGYVMHYGVLPSGLGRAIQDGTISPSGPAGSMPFTPIESLEALRFLYVNYPELWGGYGFKDSINVEESWISEKYSGLGTGISLLMIENFRSNLICKTFMKSIYARNALRRAGFTQHD